MRLLVGVDAFRSSRGLTLPRDNLRVPAFTPSVRGVRVHQCVLIKLYPCLWLYVRIGLHSPTWASSLARLCTRDGLLTLAVLRSRTRLCELGSSTALAVWESPPLLIVLSALYTGAALHSHVSPLACFRLPPLISVGLCLPVPLRALTRTRAPDSSPLRPFLLRPLRLYVCDELRAFCVLRLLPCFRTRLRPPAPALLCSFAGSYVRCNVCSLCVRAVTLSLQRLRTSVGMLAAVGPCSHTLVQDIQHASSFLSSHAPLLMYSMSLSLAFTCLPILNGLFTLFTLLCIVRTRACNCLVLQ
eukprot:4680945-Pleurochrysis_carterae.AAC.1